MAKERPNLFTYASETRKEGESWNDAKARAKRELDQKFQSSKKATEPKVKKEISNDRKDYDSNEAFFKRHH